MKIKRRWRAWREVRALERDVEHAYRVWFRASMTAQELGVIDCLSPAYGQTLRDSRELHDSFLRAQVRAEHARTRFEFGDY